MKKATEQRVPTDHPRPTLRLWVSWGLIFSGLSVVSVPLAWQRYTNTSGRARAEDALAEWDSTARVGPRGVAWLKAAHGAKQQVVPTDLFLLEIPRLSVRRVFSDHADPTTLRTFGVGHISWSAWPEEQGTVVIAGHRTTYGAPFYALDHLRPSDLVRLRMGKNTYTYAVSEKVRVLPQQVEVVLSYRGHRLALVTCDPPYSARYRLVVFADLIASNRE